MRSKKYTSRISIARNAYLRSSAVLIFFVVVEVLLVIGDLRGVLRRLLVEDLEGWDDGEGVSIFLYIGVCRRTLCGGNETNDDSLGG
mmetsp:Transcript_7461/g.12674  ORF Transcript_7461/g.12674 Transcript_7461/m.12674 type:complete len:87 (+) Transcript_7461:244-504(+)